MRGRLCKVKLTRRRSRIAVRSRLSSASSGFPQRPKQFDERGKLIVRVQAARIGQHPYAGAVEQPRLRTDWSILQGKSVAVGAHAEEREGLRSVATDLRRQALAPSDEFCGIELVGRGGTPVDEVGDAVTGFQ